MSLLNAHYNSRSGWNSLLAMNRRRTEVDPDEVDRVIELARRTPGLAEYEGALRKLAVFFSAATREFRDHAPGELADLVAFWDRYKAAVVQRFTGVTPAILRSADAVVANVFDRFLESVPNSSIAYDADARPLVYGGEGGIGAYFTHPPGWNRPFAIINLPHAAFDNVWQWLALPHETGHDIYAAVDGLGSEVEGALVSAMNEAVDRGDITLNDVELDLNPVGIGLIIRYTGKQFLAKVWRSWANEAQADIVGLLSCGGASLAALQQIIGFETEDAWVVHGSGADLSDDPEEHPTGYIRNVLNIEALRLIDGGSHESLADELQLRFTELAPAADAIIWKLGRFLVVAHVPISEMIKSARVAAEVLVNHKFASLGNKSYSDIATFTAADQMKVNGMIDRLLDGDPTFAQDAEPRHALASTVFAFEKDRARADQINATFGHFV